MWTNKKLQRPQVMDTPPFKNLVYGQFRFGQFADIIVLRYRHLSSICKSEFFSKNHPPNCFYIVLPSVSSHCHHPPSHTTKKKTASSQSSLDALHFFRQFNDIIRTMYFQEQNRPLMIKSVQKRPLKSVY